MTSLLVVTALRTEQAALAGRVPGARLVRCGMGASRVASWLSQRPAADAVVIAGLAGGLDPALRTGDVLVADDVRDEDGRCVPLRSAAPLVAELRRLGLRVHHGPLLTTSTLVERADERRRLAATGALAVDMESAPIAHAYRDVPTAVVRVVVDTAASPLLRPATVSNGVAALRTLRRLGPALVMSAESAGPHRASGVVDASEGVHTEEDATFGLRRE